MRCGRRSSLPSGGDQPALGLRQPELGVPRRDDHVAGQGHLAAAGERVALDGGDQRLGRRALGDAGEPAALDGGVVAGQEALEVHPGAERPARAGEDADGQVLAGVELVDGRRDPLRHLAVDRVAGLGAIDGDDEDCAVFFGKHRVVAGGVGVVPSGDTASVMGASLRLEADAAVETDRLAVHVVVLDQGLDEVGELRRLAHPLRERDGRGELGLERLRGLALAVDRGVDDAGADGVDPDADRGEVARRRSVMPMIPPLDAE